MQAPAMLKVRSYVTRYTITPCTNYTKSYKQNMCYYRHLWWAKPSQKLVYKTLRKENHSI